MSNVKLGDLIEPEEAEDLVAYVKTKRNFPNPPTVNNLVMRWLDTHPLVVARFVRYGVFKQYGAYLFEHYLQLK